MADGHGCRIKRHHVAHEADDVAHHHQRRADREREVIEIHREAELGRAAFIEHPAGFDDLPAVPDHAAEEEDGGEAVEHLHPALALGRQYAEHEVWADMAVLADELAGDDHDRPDQQVDNHLIPPAGAEGTVEIAAEDLPHADAHGAEAEQADQGLFQTVPKFGHSHALPARLMRCAGGGVKA